MEREIIKLQAIRVAGYVNFLFLVVSLLQIKTNMLPVMVPFIISAIGVLTYSFWWGKLFKYVSKNEGRKYIRPYILGVVVIFSAMLLIPILIFFKTHGHT